MTIKSRLFISNILMILLPVLLTGIIGLTVAIVIFNVTDTWPPAQNRAIYVNENIALEYLQNGDYAQIADGAVVYQSDSHGYVIVLPDNAGIPNSFELKYDNRLIRFLISSFILIAIVYLTNLVLTRHIFRSIMSPIETLVNGVHEIRDGNLTYRIDYHKNDEFAAVCSDFNEMAGQLLDMVNQRQKDERNRRELIAGISHDLRTPLTSIKAYLEGIEKGVASTPEMQQKYLETIKSKTTDLEYIINQLFLFSKLDLGEFPFKLERVNIGQELMEMVAGLSDEYRDKGLTLSLVEKTEDVDCQIDTVQFRNVVYNILDNSVKYKNKDFIDSQISCQDRGDHVLIQIDDNGPGVAGGKAEKLFDVFYRGDAARNNSSKGSGLGLAIAAKIIERLEGTISAQNLQDGGLKIIITLPKHRGEHDNEKNTDH